MAISTHRVDPPGVDRPGVDRPGVDPRGLDLPGADPRGLDLPGADPRGLDLPGANQPNDPGSRIHDEGIYRPGVCNIGPAEIARRRRAGHAGTVATVALGGVLVALRAPRIARLAVLLPAAGAGAGYLQASWKFCAGFGSRGVYNFDELGQTTAIASDADRARDRRRSMEIGLASLGIGALVGIAAVVLPV